MLGMIGFSYASVPLYRAFCQVGFLFKNKARLLCVVQSQAVAVHTNVNEYVCVRYASKAGWGTQGSSTTRGSLWFY